MAEKVVAVKVEALDQETVFPAVSIAAGKDQMEGNITFPIPDASVDIGFIVDLSFDGGRTWRESMTCSGGKGDARASERPADPQNPILWSIGHDGRPALVRIRLGSSRVHAAIVEIK